MLCLCLREGGQSRWKANQLTLTSGGHVHGPEKGCRSVSYTHLDVYKRQATLYESGVHRAPAWTTNTNPVWCWIRLKPRPQLIGGPMPGPFKNSLIFERINITFRASEILKTALTRRVPEVQITDLNETWGDV